MSEEFTHYDSGYGVSECGRSLYNPKITTVKADVDCPSCLEVISEIERDKDIEQFIHDCGKMGTGNHSLHSLKVRFLDLSTTNKG